MAKCTFSPKVRQELFDKAKAEAESDPEMKDAPYTSTEYAEAFVRMAECGEWKGCKSKDHKVVARNFENYCKKTFLRELKQVLAERHERN